MSAKTTVSNKLKYIMFEVGYLKRKGTMWNSGFINPYFEVTTVTYEKLKLSL